MKRRRTAGLAAVSAVAALALAACGSSGSSSGPKTAPVTYNEATTQVVNPSNQKGGTLTFGLSNTPDSTDPGNTYYAFMWNTVRLYGMSLTTYKSCPGKCGTQVVPMLATSLGQVSDNGLIWTYHIQPNVKFEDGTTVTSQDVKYAVERTYARSVLPNGPSYFQVLLKDPTYPGPYTDRSKNEFGLTSVTTPNPTTIVFHLQHPFADFDYVVAIPQTVPVPPNKDTGANYQLHPISTGPFMFQSYTLNKQFTLVRNPYWNAATDPQVRQLPDKIVFNLNLNANDIDNRLLAGDLDVDQAGTGVQTAARAKILSSPTLKQNADDALSGFLWFAYLNTKVAPLNNVACRRAIEYAANKQTLQTAYGGPLVGGDIATTVMPPTIIGYQSFDLYKSLTQPIWRRRRREGSAQAVRSPERLLHQHRLPVRPAQGSTRRPGSSAGTVPGRDQGQSAGLPVRQVLHQLRWLDRVRPLPRPGHRLRWLGRGLAGRLRLPRRDLERQRDRDLRWQHQHRGAQRPGGQRGLREGSEPAGRESAERDLDPDRPPDHVRRGNPADRLLQGAALPVAEPDECLCPRLLRHVQLRRPRREAAAGNR